MPRVVSALPRAEVEPPKSLDELTEMLEDLFAQVWNDQVKLGKAKELNNTAGKLVGLMKVACVNAALRGEVPSSPFLAGASAPGPKPRALPKPRGK